MGNGVERRAVSPMTTFFSYGFRPFFLGAALFAARHSAARNGSATTSSNFSSVSA